MCLSAVLLFYEGYTVDSPDRGYLIYFSDICVRERLNMGNLAR